MIKRSLATWVVVVCVAIGGLGQSCATRAFFASPGSGGEAQAVLLQSIAGATETLAIAVSSFTDDQLGAAVIQAHRRGVSVRVILAGGREREIGSEYEKFLSAGVPVKLSYASETFEHQFAIIDQRIVLTGSYEWANPASMGAFSSLVRITCPGAAEASAVQTYLAEFDQLWAKWEAGEPTVPPGTSPDLYFSVIIFSVDPVSQYIYLLNLSDQPIDLCDWSLSDLEGQYTFPCEDEEGNKEEDSVIHPGEPYRIWIDELDPAYVAGDFHLDTENDEVFLLTPEGDIVDEVVW